MKLKNFLLVLLLSSSSLLAQEPKGILGKLGMNVAKPDASYSFEGNMVQRVTITSKKGKQTQMDTQMFFGKNDAFVGSKIIDSNDPDMKKSLENIEFTIVDIGKSKIFNFMNTDGTKMVMGVGFKGDKINEAIEKENAKITISKTGQTKSILGYTCDGYSIKTDKDKTDITLWISQKPLTDFTRLGKNISKAYGGLSQGKSNYFAYNSHPELAKIAAEGRGVLGYSAKTDNGEASEMEIIKFNPSEKFTFISSDYKSMF